jgi:TRAP-type C4-dicarboxylate transport system permease small subunit
MKRTLRIVALLIVLAAAGFWLAAGANRGWTKNQVEKKTLDEVTGIEGIAYEKKFVPGLDFLGAAVVVAGFLAGVSFLLRNHEKPQPSN